ncbi:MAG: DNA primase [Paracoccaceae bacterium]
MASSNSFIQELREKVSLSEVVGKKVQWDSRKTNQRNGDFWACCPFHEEKTASFKVDDKKGFYYCFGCHEKGDVITFLREIENLDFFSAIKHLAFLAGLEIPKNFGPKKTSTDENINKTLVDLHNLAVDFYKNHLTQKPPLEVAQFLENRISSRKIIEDFKLGFAPEGKKNLYDHLCHQGYSTETIVKSGLCARNEQGKIYDRFRNRIIFPIKNHADQVVGLGGRALSSSAKAKYLNSPETEIFHKGRLLFNQNNFSGQKQAKSKLIVVEGYMDVIALSKIGFKNCVAPLGTAVTSDQLQKIWRLSNNPIFAFDGDDSGERALVRLAFLALPLISAEKTIQACKLPTGQDPDDIVSKFGADALVNLLEKPKSLHEVLWEHETKGMSFKIPENRSLLDNRIKSILKNIMDINLRNHFSSAFFELKRKLFSMDENSFANFRSSQGLLKHKSKKLNKNQTNQATSSTKKSLLGGKNKPNFMESRFQETAIVISLINHPELATYFASKLSEVNFFFKDLQKIYDNIILLKSQLRGGNQSFLECLNEKCGYDVYTKLISTGHLKVNPYFKELTSFGETQLILDDVLTKKIARQNINQELSDAQEDIKDNNDEALTWRLVQANQFLHEAQIGSNMVNRFDDENLERDITEIKNLIKDEIWIKKKSK